MQSIQSNQHIHSDQNNLSRFQIFLLNKLDEFLYNQLEFCQYCLIKFHLLRGSKCINVIKEKFNQTLSVSAIPSIFIDTYNFLVRKNYRIDKPDFKVIINEFQIRNMIDNNKQNMINEFMNEFENISEWPVQLEKLINSDPENILMNLPKNSQG